MYTFVQTNSQLYIIMLTLELFCIILLYQYVVIEVFVAHFTINHYYYCLFLLVFLMFFCLGCNSVVEDWHICVNKSHTFVLYFLSYAYAGVMRGYSSARKCQNQFHRLTACLLFINKIQFHKVIMLPLIGIILSYTCTSKY